MSGNIVKHIIFVSYSHSHGCEVASFCMSAMYFGTVESLVPASELGYIGEQNISGPVIIICIYPPPSNSGK